MTESTYKFIELTGTSTESWEKAVEFAIATAAETIRDLRVGEITSMDVAIKDGKIETYRVKVKVSFKYVP